MIREGQIVRAGASEPMKVVDIFRGMARCLQVDQHGRIRQRFFYTSQLAPLEISIGPKTCWPHAADIPEAEEPRTITPSSARARRKATKPKRSHKIKTRSAMSAIERVFFEIEEWRAGKLWGAKRIAQFCDVHPDTVARWADDPACPITKVGGRLFVLREALVAWMTSKDAA